MKLSGSGTILRYYLRVFSSFIFLSFLMVSLPVLASLILSETPTNTQGGSYFYVGFTKSNYSNIHYLKIGEEPPVGYSGVIVGFNNLDMGSIVQTLSEYRARLYFPVSIGDEVFFLPYGTEINHDCTVLAGVVKRKGQIQGYAEIKNGKKIILERFSLPSCSFNNYSPKSKESSEVLKALANYIYSETGSPVYIPSEDVYSSIMNISHGGKLDVTGFLFVSERPVDPNKVYSSLLPLTKEYGLYPNIYVITPYWMNQQKHRNIKYRNILKSLWEYFLLLIPMLPLMFILMRNEGENEKMLKLIIKSFGGSPLLVDLLTVLIIGIATSVAFTWLAPSYGAFVLFILLLLFLFRYKVSNVQISKNILLLFFTLIYVFLFLSVGMGTHLRSMVATLFSFLFSFEHSLRVRMFLTIFHYSPVLFGCLALSFLLLLISSLRGSPAIKGLARTISVSFVVISTVLLYSGLIYASPVTSLYSVSDVGYGATIFVELNVTNPEVLSAYSSITENISKMNGHYGTLWYLGLLENEENNTIVGSVMGYGDTLIKFLKSAEWRSDQARILYNALKTRDAVISESSRAWLSNGFVQGEVISGNSTLRLRMRYTKVNTLLPSYLGAVLIPKNSGNFTAIPKYVLVYGGIKLYKVLESLKEKYNAIEQVTCLKTGEKSLINGVYQEIPPIVSFIVLILTPIVLAVRDRKQMKSLKKLLISGGAESLCSLITLIPMIPLSLIPIRPLIDALNLLRMGLISTNFILVILPLVSLLLAPILYSLVISVYLKT